MTEQIRVLLSGDAGCHTGFARVTHALCDRFIAQHDLDVHVLAVNWLGTPEVTTGALDQRRMWKANPQDHNDVYGLKQIPKMVAHVRPDVIVIYNDLPVAQMLIDAFQAAAPRTPILLYFPIDAVPVPQGWLRPLYRVQHAITFTEWARDQVLRADSSLPPPAVLPHGVDFASFYPITPDRPGTATIDGRAIPIHTRAEARAILGLGDAFVVLWSDRNAIRKAPATIFHALAPLIRQHRDIILWMHGMQQDEGGDFAYWIDRWGLARQTRITPGHTSWIGVPDTHLNVLYNAADLRVATAMGEGFGLHGAEALAVGLPQIAPDHTCFPEVLGPGALYVPTESPYTTARGVDMFPLQIGALTAAIDQLYRSPARRAELGALGRQYAQIRYGWDAIAAAFAAAIRTTAAGGVDRLLVA